MDVNNLIDFIVMQFIKVGMNFTIWYACGLLVLKRGVKTNYTRKIVHFSLLLLPFLMDMFRGQSNGASNESGNNFLLTAIGLFSGLLYLLLFIQPIRNRVKVLNTAFLSVDRPEDRPRTISWLTTQTAANLFVSLPFYAYLMMINKMELVFIVMIINGIGDGLAEPIGIRFGKHKYKTYALFTKKKYERSIEGSACVFITALLTIIIFSFSFSPTQFIIALITIPILMTLAEAIAPHSLDNPFLSLVGEILLFLILQFVI